MRRRVGVAEHVVEVDLEERGAVVEVPRARDERVQLADPAHVLAAGQHARAAPGMQERLGRGLHVPAHAHGVERGAEHALGGEEGRPRRLRRAPRLRVQAADEDAGERAVLVRELGAVVAVDVAGFEERQVGPAARDVVARGVEQRREERGAHDRVVLAHRVLEGHEAPARVVGGQAQPIGEPGLGEAPAHDLIHPAAHERVDRAAAQALLDAQAPGAAAALGQRGRQLLEAVHAGDLLDEVGLARDVVAPEGGHQHVEAAGRLLGLEAQRAQDLGLARARDRDARGAPRRDARAGG